MLEIDNKIDLRGWDWLFCDNYGQNNNIFLNIVPQTENPGMWVRSLSLGYHCVKHIQFLLG